MATSRARPAAADCYSRAGGSLPGLSELPDARRRRFVEQYGLSEYNGELLTADRDVADYYEATVEALDARTSPKLAADWIVGEVFRLVKSAEGGVAESKATPELLAELLGMLAADEVNRQSARLVLELMFETGRSPREIAQDSGLTQISDADALGTAVRTALEANPQAVSDYRGGKGQAIAFLIGQVMRETRGAANADTVRKLLLAELSREQ
ncbi:MAG: hypothetical protein WKH64_05745 [Chloroflexia bacterium]